MAFSFEYTLQGRLVIFFSYCQQMIHTVGRCGGFRAESHRQGREIKKH